MIYQVVFLYNSLQHDVYHVLASKAKSLVCAFVGSISLNIYSIIHSINVPVPGIEPGTGKSMEPNTDMIPGTMELTFTIRGEVEDIL